VGRDLLFSVILHLVVLAATIFASPLNIKRPPDIGEVIRVGVVSMSEIAPPTITPAEPEPIPETVPPQAMQDEPEEVALENPTTKPAVEIQKPAEKPKPVKPKPKPPKNEAKTGDRNQAGAAEGRVDVQAPSGSGVAGMGVDNADFNYPWYFTQTYNKLAQNFRVPVVIDGQVTCDVYFRVIKSGRVIEKRIVNPSGIPQFDQACLSAIELSEPLPPLPRGWLDEIIGLYVTFTN
jgi:colicin import membrane protein